MDVDFFYDIRSRRPDKEGPFMTISCSANDTAVTVAYREGESLDLGLGAGWFVGFFFCLAFGVGFWVFRFEIVDSVCVDRGSCVGPTHGASGFQAADGIESNGLFVDFDDLYLCCYRNISPDGHT